MEANVLSRQVDAFRSRLARVLILRECLRASITWIVIWAGIAVLLRAVFRIDPVWLCWGFLGWAGAVTIGCVLAGRQLPSASAIRAVLDGHGALGGLLMASEDAVVGRWTQKIASIPTPALRWQPRRQLALLAMSVSFLIAALLAPDRCLPTGDDTLQVGGEIQRLTERMRVLKEEKILPPEKAKAIEKDLERLRNEALGKDPAKTMEALDHLGQSFSKVAAETAEKIIKQAEQATQAQEIAQALAAQGQMDPQKCGEAMKELARMAEQAAAENEALSGELSEELQAALSEGTVTAEQLRQLGNALKDCKAGGQAKLMKLVQARLVDAKELMRCEQAGQCPGGAGEGEDAQAIALGEGEGEDGQDAIAMDGDGRPGRGGISRGRGDAAITWQDAVKKGDAAFKETVLPPASAAALKESRLLGISAGDPTSSKPGGSSVGGALSSAQAGGGEARTQIILPEHEKAVQRYFNREKK